MSKQFTLYWLTGKREVITGETIEQAFTAAGYGAGALKAVDFYENGDNTDYAWNSAKRSWDRIAPLGIETVVANQGQYKLFVSHNLGISYGCEYSTDNKDDPELKRRIEEATQKVLRFYVEGDDDILCPQHANIVQFLNRHPDLNRGNDVQIKVVKLNSSGQVQQRSIEQQAELLRNKFCR